MDEDNRILATGYNGVPRGFKHCIDAPCPGRNDEKGDTSRCLAVHAEANALIQCMRLDLAHTLYASCCPCFQCAKLIANTSIERVVCLETYPDSGAAILGQAGIVLVIAEGSS